MDRPLNSSFNTVAPLSVAAGHAIAQVGETDVSPENLNYLHGRQWSPWIQQCFQSNTGAPYIEPTSTSYVVNGIWRRKPYSDLDQWFLRYYVENGGTQSGTIKFEMASDAATLVVTDTIAAAAPAGWQSASLDMDGSQSRDTLRLSTKEDAATGAVMRMHSLCVEPKPFSSITAGKTSAGYVPLDTVEYAANEPMSTWARQVAVDNLEVLRKTRSDTIVAWSEDWNARANAAYSITSSTYTKVAEIRFRAGIGQDTIEWSTTGFLAAGGTSGGVKVTTGYMEDVLGTDVEQAFSTIAASPYTGNIHDPSDLTCLPNQEGVLNVYLKGDGSAAGVLMGLCAWFKDVT